MAKTNKYVHFSTRAAFNSELSKLGITNPSVAEGNSFYYYTVYIKDTNEIYTHGRFYNQENHKILYISTDKAIVTPFDDSVFGGANIVSNTYVNEIGEIVFDRKLDTIGEAAFRGCSTIKSIVLPDSIRFIEDSAFYGCSELEHIVVPKNVRNIYRAAFQQCNKLTEITILGCPEIGANVFYGDINLLRIFLYGHKTITIDETCFSEDLPNNCCIHVPAHLLQDYKELYLTHANYFISFVESNALRTINGQSLIGSEDLSVGMIIAEDVGEVVEDVESAPYIKYVAQELTEEQKVQARQNIGVEVGDIFDSSDTGLASTSDVRSYVEQTYYQPNNEIWYTTTDGNVVTPYSTATFGANIVSNTYSNGKGVIKFDADVTQLGSHAFDGCSTLVTMSIPTTVTDIQTYAFYNCTGLVEFDIPDTVTTLGGHVFHKCTALKYINVGLGVTLLPTYMCHSCSSLVRVNVPDSITRINSYCFYGCSALQRFTIPNSVTNIETSAFRNTSLVEVDIPNNVTTIGTYAFSYCSKLRKVTIGLGVTSIASYAFASSTAIKQINCNANSVPTLGATGVFTLAFSAGKIYVPISLYESYISATNWSTYAQSIKAYMESSMLKTINGETILGTGEFNLEPSYSIRARLPYDSYEGDDGDYVENYDEIFDTSDEAYFYCYMLDHVLTTVPMIADGIDFDDNIVEAIITLPSGSTNSIIKCGMLMTTTDTVPEITFMGYDSANPQELRDITLHWPNGTAPEFEANCVYEIWFSSYDGGNVWYGVCSRY